MFHDHSFIISQFDPETLYCMCGKVKDIHRHEWVDSGMTITGNVSNTQKGIIMRCKKCGALNNHYV